MYIHRLFIILLNILLLIISCKKKDNKPLTISIVSGSVGKELKVLEEQIAIFEGLNPDIDVVLIESPETQDRKYKQYVNWLKDSTSGIDIYVIDIVWTAEFAEKGWLIPLNDYIKAGNIDINDFLHSAIKADKWKGHIIALPWFTDAGILYYRKDLLKKYSLKVPDTWEELELVAKEIVRKERKENPYIVGFVFQADKYEGLTANYLEYIRGEGTDVFNNKGEVILNNQKAIKGLETYIKMLKISAPGILVFQEEDGRNYFQSGNSVFMRNWPYAWSLLNGENSDVKDKFSIAPLPGGQSGLKGISTLGGWHLAISSYSQYPEEAFKLISFLTSARQQSYKAIRAGQSPTRKTCYQDPQVIEANSYTKYLFDIVQMAYPRPVHPEYSKISRIIQQEVYSALGGKKTPALATDTMAKEIKKIISGKDISEKY